MVKLIYNVSDGTLNTHDDLANDVSNTNSATMIGDVLYYYSTGDGALSSYDTQTNIENFAFSNSPVDLTYACMTANFTDSTNPRRKDEYATKLYVLGDSNTKSLYIYDIEKGYWETSSTT